MNIRFLPPLLTLVLFLTPHTGHAQTNAAPAAPGPTFVVVVNDANPATAISEEGLQRIFLGKTAEVDERTYVCIRPQSSAIYAEFRATILHMTEQQEKAYWIKETFRGTVRFGKEVDSPDAVADSLATDADAIGISTHDAIVGKPHIKVLTILSP